MTPPPLSTPDSRWWWTAVEQEKLLIQRCDGCQRLRHPPVPACPNCQSLDWSSVSASGRGTVYSVTVLHHPPMPGFAYPLAAAVIQLEEGTRVVSTVTGVDPEEVRIGQSVTVEFFEVADGSRLHRFRVVGS